VGDRSLNSKLRELLLSHQWSLVQEVLRLRKDRLVALLVQGSRMVPDDRLRGAIYELSALLEENSLLEIAEDVGMVPAGIDTPRGEPLPYDTMPLEPTAEET